MTQRDEFERCWPWLDASLASFGRTLRRSLRLILRRVRQPPFMLEHLAEITTVDPAAAGRAPEEMLGLARWRIADALA